MTVDPIFAERRLAEIYDPLDLDRSDLDTYAAMIDEFGARSVLDIGCGTGTSLAAAGYIVDEVRGAPDRPGRELVFTARSATGGVPGTSGPREPGFRYPIRSISP